MKTILENILNNDTSYNKSATKMLRNTNPGLWSKILEVTSFLPDNAKPKQRVWHILNEKYSIEVCPVTGDALRWNEKDYRRFSSIEAKNKAIGKIISKSTTDNHWRQKDSEKSKKANEKFSTGFKNGEHKPWNERNRDYKASLAAARKTWIEKYGVDNPSKHPTIKQKLSDRNKEWQSLNPKDRTLVEEYYNAVKLVTNKNWYEHFYDINPNKLERSNELHLDHIYSISEGFKNNIPAEVIGHWTNLRLLPKIENSSKGAKCHKTIEELFEDYNRENSN
jgi:hypothetical protein